MKPLPGEPGDPRVCRRRLGVGSRSGEGAAGPRDGGVVRGGREVDRVRAEECRRRHVRRSGPAEHCSTRVRPTPTARAASTMPPVAVLPARPASGLVVLSTCWTSCAAVSDGWRPATSATTPET